MKRGRVVYYMCVDVLQARREYDERLLVQDEAGHDLCTIERIVSVSRGRRNHHARYKSAYARPTGVFTTTLQFVEKTLIASRFVRPNAHVARVMLTTSGTEVGASPLLGNQLPQRALHRTWSAWRINLAIVSVVARMRRNSRRARKAN